MNFDRTAKKGLHLEEPDKTSKCTKCGARKPVADFPVQNGKRLRWCRDCKRDYGNAWYHHKVQRLCDNPPTVPETKRCSHCKRELPSTSFRFSAASNTGLVAYCRDCEREYGRQDRLKDRRLRRTFGITLDQFNQMLAAQKGVCAICGNPQRQVNAYSGQTVALHVDHDHSTGQVRGLLCSQCNTGIGALGHDPDVLKKAIQYLEGYQSAPNSELRCGQG